MTDVRVHNVAGGAFQRFVGDRVVLRPVMPSDVPFLYEIANSDKNAFRWRFRGAAVDGAVRGRRQPGLVPAPRGPRQGIRRARRLRLGLRLRPEQRRLLRRGADGRVGRRPASGAQGAMELFITHLFRASPLRKIYAEVPGMTFDGVEESAINEASTRGS